MLCVRKASAESGFGCLQEETRSRDRGRGRTGEVRFLGDVENSPLPLSSVAAPTNCTASIGAVPELRRLSRPGFFLLYVTSTCAWGGGALAPTVTGVIVQRTGSFVPASVVGAVRRTTSSSISRSPPPILTLFRAKSPRRSRRAAGNATRALVERRNDD